MEGAGQGQSNDEGADDPAGEHAFLRLIAMTERALDRAADESSRNEPTDDEDEGPPRGPPLLFGQELPEEAQELIHLGLPTIQTSAR